MSSHFSKVILKLLSGEIIDSVTSKALIDWLSIDDNWLDVESYLQRIDRQPLYTSDKAGVYLGYLEVNSKDHKRVIRKRFEQFSIKLYPLILWLRLARSCMDVSRPLQVNDVIKQSELLASIEDSKQLEMQLDEIITKLNRNSREPKQQVTSLLDYLESEGFLYAMGSTGSIFKATAKWSLLYDQLEYINKYQMIITDEEAQGGLNLEPSDLTTFSTSKMQ